MRPVAVRRRPVLRHEPKRHRYVACASLGVLLSGLLLFAAPGRAQVSCADPDNLCTGDPCVIPTLAVATPCVVDFGTRALVIAGRLSVPVQGELSFTAGSIAVTGTVMGVGGAPTNQTTPIAITLAAAGDIDVRGSVKLIARDFPGNARGTITLDAGRDVHVEGRIKAIARIRGGSVRIEADRDISVKKPIKTSSTTRAGNITLTAARDIAVLASLTASAGGATESEPGYVDLEASGTLSVAARVRASALGAYATGGSVSLRGATGVMVEGIVNCRGVRGAGGGVTIESSGGSVAIDRAIVASGRDGSGFVYITAAGDVTVNDPLLADVFLPPGQGGGYITLSSTAGNVALNAKIVALSVELTTPGAVAINADINLHHGDSSGRTAFIHGGSLQVADGVTINADGNGFNNAGYLELEATAGDLVLAGTFLAGGAEGGGSIIGDATGNLTASGRFEVVPAGCIALTAGGTLDTTGGDFDTPVTSSCP